MHNVEIRDATVEELRQLHEGTLAAYAEYERRMEPSAWVGLAGAVQSALTNPAPEVVKIVALRMGRVVGSVLLFPPSIDPYGGAAAASTAPEIRLLAVAPEERGRGIGRRLVEECIRRARAMGATALGLHTSPTMVEAVRMYEKMGFERHPELDFFPEGAEIVTAYRLELG